MKRTQTRQAARRKVASPSQKSKSKSLKETEFTLYGWNACMRAFERRPEDILRIYFSRERSSRLGAVKKWCSERKLPYRQLDESSLKKVADGTHHEGVVFVVRPLQLQKAVTLIRKPFPPDGIVVALDGIGNTHNLGAILRSCAYFGAQGMMAEFKEGQAVFTPSAARTAEGALETIPVYQCTDLPSALRDLKESGVFVLGADVTASRTVYDLKIPVPCVVVLGNEQTGLSPRVKRRCNELVSIPGTGNIESLNVSVAAGVILSELNRRLRSPAK